MVSILLDPSYSRSIWCKSLLESLTSQLKFKRIPYEMADSLEEIGAEARHIFLIGADTTWVQSALSACSKLDIYPILISNESHHAFSYRYSTVCSDVMSSMRYLVNWLMLHNRSRIGLYGVNPESISDLSRLNGYQSALSFTQPYIYYNKLSLEQCYQCFEQQTEPLDAVICTNGFAAISLVRHLAEDHPEYLKRLLIISCQEVELTNFYSDDILNVHLNFAEYGKAAVLLYENLCKAPYLSHIVMSVSWDMSDLDRRQPACNALLPRTDSSITLSPPRDTFYEDSELGEMMLLEKLLYESTQEDRLILSGLLQGDSYNAIADRCFFTVSTIKYRVKKMVAQSRLEDKSELLDLIRKYIGTIPLD